MRNLKVPLLGSKTRWSCGQLKSIERHKSGETIMNWSNWGQYDDQSESHCKGCSFEKNCSIINLASSISSERYFSLSMSGIKSHILSLSYLPMSNFVSPLSSEFSLNGFVAIFHGLYGSRQTISSIFRFSLAHACLLLSGIWRRKYALI